MCRRARCFFALAEIFADAQLEFGNFAELRVRLFQHGGQLAIFRDVNVPQQLTQFFAQHAVTTCLCSLAAQAVYLSIDLGDDVGDARQVGARVFESRFGGALAHAKLRDARGFFDDGAPVHRLGGKNLADAALFDDGVVATGETGAGEEILDVAQATDFVVQQVFALA